MITENFKNALQSLQLSSTQIEMIRRYISREKVRVNADCIEYPDGSTYYSEEYLLEMMKRERIHGKTEGQQEPVKHIAETIISPCPNCGHEFVNKQQ